MMHFNTILFTQVTILSFFGQFTERIQIYTLYSTLKMIDFIYSRNKNVVASYSFPHNMRSDTHLALKYYIKTPTMS